MRYTSKRSYQWNADIAYSVGLIASDGCLQKDGRHIDLTSTDMEQLQNFALALGREMYIGPKKSGASHQAYRIQFSDVAYYDFLLTAGLTPDKSKTIGSLEIPDEYYAAFLRGLFDGDGTCYGYYDLRWKSSFMFYVGFATASEAFAQYIRTSNTRLIGTSAGSIRHSPRVLSLMYAKKDAHLLAEFMYADGSSLRLTRKYQKLLEFVHHDQTAILNR